MGGGHAHLEVLRRAAEFRAAGARLVLIDPGDFRYSGGASAVLGGSLTEAENRVDLAWLCGTRGVDRMRARVAGLDRARRRIVLGDSREIPFALVSFNVGNRAKLGNIADDEAGYAVKPLADLLRLRADLLVAERAGARVLVVGGGPTGTEIAGNLARLARAEGKALQVTLLAGGEGLLEGLPTRAGRIAARSLGRQGVEIVRGAKLVSVGGGEALLTSGATLSYDRIVLATGLAADPLMARLGLPIGEDGGLLVGTGLASPIDPSVFAVGDCASFADRPLPKAGVFGVRAAPVLVRNLLAALRGEPLRGFRPQRTWLSILDLGDGTGLAVRGSLVLHGRSVLGWKRRIDRQFLDRYRLTPSA